MVVFVDAVAAAAAAAAIAVANVTNHSYVAVNCEVKVSSIIIYLVENKIDLFANLPHSDIDHCMVVNCFDSVMAVIAVVVSAEVFSVMTEEY